MEHQLPSLLYAYNALEPYIDARTMELHYTKHHATYVSKLNDALKSFPELQSMPVEKLLARLSDVPEAIRLAVRNHGGGHANHSLFWSVMAPAGLGGGGTPNGALAAEIEKQFGNFATFTDVFSKSAMALFGSGWVWLTKDAAYKLAVTTTPNQDSPIMSNETPILGLDLWEHAYYLKYQNRRAEYVTAWWNVVNWEAAGANFLQR